jgi:hypothetical protein
VDIAVEVAGEGVDGSGAAEVDGCGGGLEAAVAIAFVEEELGVACGFVAWKDGGDVGVAVSVEVAGEEEFVGGCGDSVGDGEGTVSAA